MHSFRYASQYLLTPAQNGMSYRQAVPGEIARKAPRLFLTGGSAAPASQQSTQPLGSRCFVPGCIGRDPRGGQGKHKVRENATRLIGSLITRVPVFSIVSFFTTCSRIIALTFRHVWA